ncbi:hypothetical protein ACRQ1B_27450 [Rhizobium panacihumi]
MPFYLVTQTSLIEAPDEEAAAQKVIERIRSGAQVAVSVRFDEATVSHLIVAARSECRSDTPSPIPLPANVPQFLETEVASTGLGEKQLILKRMMANAWALVMWRR